MGDHGSPAADAARILAEYEAGNQAALGRLFTLVENGDPVGDAVIDLLFPRSGAAKVIGITGAPGVGKSSLVDRLALLLAESGARVAVLAVDPSSPFTGGAILGDRIRMGRAALHPGVFVRSLSSRGALGGLSAGFSDMLYVACGAGFDYVLVETVGVGQAEVDIIAYSDAVVVVLVPGLGDSIQALKAGLLEVADLFVVNKSDLPGADRVVKDLKSLLTLAPVDRTPAIVPTSAPSGSGVPELLAAFQAHYEALVTSGGLAARRKTWAAYALERAVGDIALRRVLSAVPSADLEQAKEAVALRRSSPRRQAELLLGRGDTPFS